MQYFQSLNTFSLNSKYADTQKTLSPIPLPFLKPYKENMSSRTKYSWKPNITYTAWFSMLTSFTCQLQSFSEYLPSTGKDKNLEEKTVWSLNLQDACVAEKLTQEEGRAKAFLFYFTSSFTVGAKSGPWTIQKVFFFLV